MLSRCTYFFSIGEIISGFNSQRPSPRPGTLNSNATPTPNQRPTWLVCQLVVCARKGSICCCSGASKEPCLVIRGGFTAAPHPTSPVHRAISYVHDQISSFFIFVSLLFWELETKSMGSTAFSVVQRLSQRQQQWLNWSGCSIRS